MMWPSWSAREVTTLVNISPRIDADQKFSGLIYNLSFVRVQEISVKLLDFFQ
jgi:hypothetical protein